MDLDRFKTINDTMGHPVGDSILYQLSAVLQENIRGVDVAGRCGGDEFAVMLPETDLETGIAVAERIRRCVESHPFYAVPIDHFKSSDFVPDERRIIHPTVTIGVACYPSDEQTAPGIVMAADVALFKAKRINRNRVGVYNKDGVAGDASDPHGVYRMLRERKAGNAQPGLGMLDKDWRSRSHAESVTTYAVTIGRALGVDQVMLDSLKVAGLLHDLGKIGMPEEILNKQGSLTREEHEAIRRHPSIGSRILKDALHLNDLAPAVMYHHERWDGAGYPSGLSGERIPLMARILAVADAFDAMTSDRPYRKAMSVQDALVELRANAGKQFDPMVVEACISNFQVESQKIVTADKPSRLEQADEPVIILDMIKMRSDDN